MHNVSGFETKGDRRPKKAQSNDLSPDKQKRLRELALNCILEDGRSFNDLTKPGIAKLFDGLLEGMSESYVRDVREGDFVGFRAPHRNTVTRNLKRLKRVHLKNLVRRLKEVQFLAITTDFWTDHKSMSYVCITGHFFDEHSDLKSRVLVFAPFRDRHTSDNISSELELHLKNLKVYDKVTTITCDGASNMRASFKSLRKNIKRVQCLAHKLHLIICNGLGMWIKMKEQKSQETSKGRYLFSKARLRMTRDAQLKYLVGQGRSE